MRRALLASALLVATAWMSPPTASAATFTWANDGDTNSMDPYTRSETFLLSFASNIYEPLVRKDRNMKIEPALAEKWETVSPTIWRFHLRPGVKWQDGSPFTSADVVFSAQRVMGKGSNLQANLATVKDVRAVDPMTVEIETKQPNPILLQDLSGWLIMSKAWSEANGAANVADLTTKEENYATRHAMGTGPYRLVSREPDRRTVLEANPAWWDKRIGNVDRAEFNVIANGATRVAALISGEVQFVYTVPPQDVDRLEKTPHVKIVQGPELRTIYLGMDQSRPELLKSDVKGKNPFKDIRVRKAFYEAIDEKAIAARIMRGQARPTGLIYGPGVNGFREADDVRWPTDVTEAKKLLADAGYPNGFGVTMDCPNDRYVNDEAICTAVVSMLARIGVKVTLNAQTRARFFAEVNAPTFNTSFYLLGWTPSTGDALNSFFNLAATRDGSRGVFNNGGISDPKLDKLIEDMAVNTDPEGRQQQITEASKIIHDQVYYIPLHQQQIVWAKRDNVDVVQTADNYFQLRYVNVH